MVWIAPATPAVEAERLAALRAGFKDNRLVEGRDFTFDVIYANGEYGRFP